MPTPSIKYESTEIKRTLSIKTPPKHRHTLGLPKTVPKNRIFSLFSRFLFLRRMQTHFELFILIQCIILIHGTRVILFAFPHSRVLQKYCIATAQKTTDIVCTMPTRLCFFNKKNEKPKSPILKNQHHRNKSHIFSTSFATCFCQSLTFWQLGSDSHQARLTFYG